ncbi:ABC transporter permease [Erythrobacter crassostreae]|uniref:ABC transporter permease n=1 Tax=Erythrobacter crassostreae TaxID=2828328 RepID=A0A9X1F5K6_9SPHN|nr:ABC transporter permease [Erythrobacter crassostrea]MBV7260299.1 ABC transporter permease [Erythrobacter crassostrea]
MNSRALIAFSLFELSLFFKAFLAVLFTFVMPCVILAVVVSSSEDPVAMATELVPVLVGLIIVFVAVFTLAVQLVIYTETGFYKRLLVTYIDSTAIALSNAIRGYSVVLIGLTLILAECLILTGVFPDINIFWGLVAILIGGGGFFLLAIIPACFVKSANTMFTMSTVLSYVIIFFSGTMPPFGGIGIAVNVISQFMPGYHLLGVLRAGFEGDLLTTSAMISTAYMLGCAALGIFVVRRNLSWR